VVESATSGGGGEVKTGEPVEGDVCRAIEACQGVGARRSRGCLIPIRRELMPGILPGPTPPSPYPFLCVVKLSAGFSAVPVRRKWRVSASEPSDRGCSPPIWMEPHSGEKLLRLFET
jgi:hypothetical protein